MGAKRKVFGPVQDIRKILLQEKNFEKLPDGTIKSFPKLEETTDEKCEKCSSPMVVKSGRFGKFLACSAYPECKHEKQLPWVKCPSLDAVGIWCRSVRKRPEFLFVQPVTRV